MKSDTKKFQSSVTEAREGSNIWFIKSHVIYKICLQKKEISRKFTNQTLKAKSERSDSLKQALKIIFLLPSYLACSKLKTR